MRPIDTARFSSQLRSRAIDLENRKILISRLEGSMQAVDLAAPTNCSGFGRVRHFKLETTAGWPSNPLPIVPACRALGVINVPTVMTAQVFQNAACNWRCWYCYVPFELLSANEDLSAWFQPTELVALYGAEPNRPLVLDLSGGSPDLVPEWVPWMMEALIEAGLSETTYLWSDDNLSTTYLFDELSSSQLDLIQRYRMYGRVGCFKGFDEESFAFNTGAEPSAFSHQFEVMRKLIALGVDIYAYVTLTTTDPNHIQDRIARFVDRLQAIDKNLPLRTIPLEIREFSTVIPRMTDLKRLAVIQQGVAIAAWNAEIESRYPEDMRRAPISDVSLRNGVAN